MLDTIVEYATEIDIVPFRVRKEAAGYLLNSRLIPWLQAGASLYANGVGSIADIDGVWAKALGVAPGPFHVYDVVGFNVADRANQARACTTVKAGPPACRSRTRKSGRSSGSSLALEGSSAAYRGRMSLSRGGGAPPGPRPGHSVRPARPIRVSRE